MKTAIRVFVTSLFLFWSASPGFAQGLVSVDTLEVVDANGVRVGRVHGDQQVVFEFGVRLFRVGLTFGELSGSAKLFFESTDCTGPRFMIEQSMSLIESPAIAPTNGTLYLPDQTVPETIQLSLLLRRAQCVKT